MNENEQFESLRRLLALKRHEVPPPGYFNRFSGEVIARIRAGEHPSAAAGERLFSQAPWLLRFLQMFEAKPAFASSFASALCLLLLFGIVYAERPDATPQSLWQDSQAASQPLASLTPSATPSVQPTDFLPSSLSNSSPSSLQPLFNHSFAQQVSFSPGN
jgi:hypothetical protein